ncbi:hypothetical protein C4553_02640 [Candidatus Parcubacteria bacterium]|nr:MAG: hypothetical protein C4553_02640 [Candidatus Parcubacteria bacterium]
MPDFSLRLWEFWRLRSNNIQEGREHGIKWVVAIMPGADRSKMPEELSKEVAHLMIDDGIIFDVVREVKDIDISDLNPGQRQLLEQAISSREITHLPKDRMTFITVAA